MQGLSAMGDIKLEEMKNTILRSIEALVPVADHHQDKHTRNVLLAQAASLNNLGERIELHQLPEAFVRSVINDVRLDTLMILADLKVSLTFRKQELAAPTEKLRLEAHAQRAVLEGEDDSVFLSDVSSSSHLSQVVGDLHVLKEVEGFLKDCVPLK